MRQHRIWAVGWLAASLGACGGQPWNDPYPLADARANVRYTSFEERPKHLDPARSYSSVEVPFTGSVYEPPLQYHYLKRPYQLVPLTAERVPEPIFLGADGRVLAVDAPEAQVAYSVYEVRIRQGIRYQPHPAFARDAHGRPRYQRLSTDELARIDTLADFGASGSRELVAADYVHQIKRLADPRLHSPILGLMSEHIVGLREYAQNLQAADEALKRSAGEDAYLDLERYPLAGVELVDRYVYRIKIYGKYPQLLYWLAMAFFAPVPPEVDRFYAQPGLVAKNIVLDWYPVGTGPYMLTVNNPNRRMVLERNPNFHDERYPAEGEPGDRDAGLLADAGRPLPFIDRIVFSLEKETIPYWNKFLQGYYDTSGISSDSFDEAVRFSGQGDVELTPAMQAKGIRLRTSVASTTFYLGFNMLDPVVGGYDERARKLRQALSIAVDFGEFVSIFANGRGIPAQGPLPPGIFGHRDGAAGVNPYVFRWDGQRAQRRPLADARRLLSEAGYPDGRDAQTGVPLVLNYDVTASGPEDKARLDWMRKQFQKLNIQLVVRNTDYNRFQDKVRDGNAQIFFWGWNADYPDPENFLFLLFGPNGKVAHGGENATNYENPEFDRLFAQLRSLSNGPERQALIDRAVAIARADAPWIWGFHPKQFLLAHAWNGVEKPNQMASNLLKYARLDPLARAEQRCRWNRPLVWPLALLLGLALAAMVPAWRAHRRRERASALPPRGAATTEAVERERATC